MSDYRESSYYEIALTHRQIVSVFVVLMLCVVAAFFSGLWVGQKDVTPMAMAETASLGGESSGANGMQELRFFADESAKPEPVVPETDASSTLVEDIERPAPRTEQKPVKAVPEPEKQVAQKRAPIEEPPPPLPTKVAEAAVAEIPAPIAGTGDNLVIQVFSSNDRGQAQRVVDQLKGGGHPAFLSPVEVSGRTMYRVRIGPFDERTRAEQVADTVRRSYRLDTWITQNS